jgi:cytochrome c
MVRSLALLPVLFLCGAFLCGASQAATSDAHIRRGQAIARAHCARCHAIDRHGESPNPKAPPFRLLHRRFPLEQIEEALAEGIMVGHNGPEMPQFVLGPGQINDLIAYIHTISTAQ